jgi:hypothetical protein
MSLRIAFLCFTGLLSVRIIMLCFVGLHVLPCFSWFTPSSQLH